MMLGSKIYKGIEYIQLSELPQTQREKLVQTISKDLFIKILIDGKIVGECLQFKDYAFWYNTVFKPKPTSENTATQPSIQFDSKQLAFE